MAVEEEAAVVLERVVVAMETMAGGAAVSVVVTVGEAGEAHSDAVAAVEVKARAATGSAGAEGAVESAAAVAWARAVAACQA